MSSQGPRTIDRQRRQRIVNGTIDAIVTHGVEGLSHQRIADHAKVPRSATTYYFATLEDMLEAAMQLAVTEELASFEERFRRATAADLADVLADYIVSACSADYRVAVVVSELYIAGIRRPHLREITRVWEQAWIDRLTPLVGAAAPAVSAMVGGLSIIALHHGLAPGHAELVAMIAPLLAGPVVVPTCQEPASGS